MSHKIVLPPELSRIAAGRDFITTTEYGRVISRAGQTIRKELCLTGAAYGIRPRKVGGRLLWPVAGIAELLGEGEK